VRLAMTVVLMPDCGLGNGVGGVLSETASAVRVQPPNRQVVTGAVNSLREARSRSRAGDATAMRSAHTSLLAIGRRPQKSFLPELAAWPSTRLGSAPPATLTPPRRELG
jgi:hypothetical protein